MAEQKGTESERMARILADARQRQQTYRERALKLFPWVCAHCTREFSLRKLHELTVHHKDGNHDNNPPDGSNWELLCNFCHENLHGRSADAEHYAEEQPRSVRDQAPSMKHNPFADLARRLEQKKR